MKRKSKPLMIDEILALSLLAIMAIGLLMVASSSIVYASKWHNFSLYFLFKQLTYLTLGILLMGLIVCIPMQIWYDYSYLLLILGFVALIVVLVPGIGHKVNGSMRWVRLGFLNGQPSEFTKVAFTIYMAAYISRYQFSLQQSLSGFIKPLCLLAGLALLLLLQPDFGAVVVLVVTTLSMLFLAGVRFMHFAMFLLLSLLSLVVMALSSPYRMQRLMTFLEPWANQFDSGYQLTQSLIAFGRGGWFGVGLGESIQKLFYLPEAHTDFLFAILGEELGLFGCLVVVILFAVLIGRGLYISYLALKQEQVFSAFLGFGLSVSLALQTMISIGVNIGMLPTKGLTLPFISYGGSSLLICCVQVALLFRISLENRLLSDQGIRWQRRAYSL